MLPLSGKVKALGLIKKKKKKKAYAEIATLWSKNEPSIWNWEEGKINLC